MKAFLFNIVLLLFLVGCSNKNNLNNELVRKFVKNDNTNLTFRNSSAKEKFVFVEEGLNGVIIKKVTIYFDDYPFSYSFDNCEKSGTYKTIKSVEFNKKTGQKTPLYKEVNKSCKSFIKLSNLVQFESGLMSRGSYDLNFLEGLNINNFQGFPLKLALTSKSSSTNSLLKYNDNNIIVEKYNNKGDIIAKSYIYIGKNN